MMKLMQIRGSTNLIFDWHPKQGKLYLMWAMRCFFSTAKTGGLLLDIGCSIGRFMLGAKREGWQVIGIEISRKAAEIARK